MQKISGVNKIENTSIIEGLNKHLSNIKEGSWYKDLYDKEPSFTPLEEVYKELISSPKYRSFRVSTDVYQLTDRNASWYEMEGFGVSRDPDQRIIEWQTRENRRLGSKYLDNKVYLGFKDITVPIENIRSELRLEIFYGGKQFGTSSFIIYPTDKDTVQTVTNKVFELILKYTKMAM